MAEISNKPYLIRAIYEWCADAGYTPYIGVKVDQNTKVPIEYVKNGEIVLSISLQATRNLTIGNDMIQFSARFNGVSREIAVPIYAVASIFARETGRGMFFEAESAPEGETAATPAPPSLQSVPTSGLSSVNAENAPMPAGETPGSDGAAHDDKPKGPPRGGLRIVK